MKFKDHYKPWLAVSHDDSRPHLTHVLLDVAKKVLVATNGHIMAIIPCEVEDGDVGGLIPAFALEYARKHRHAEDAANDVVRVGCASLEEVSCYDAKFKRPQGLEFPPWEAVLPNYEGRATHRINVDAEYLRRASSAIGDANWLADEDEDDDDGRVGAPANISIEYPALTDGTEPITVTRYEGGREAYVVVMPLKPPKT